MIAATADIQTLLFSRFFASCPSMARRLKALFMLLVFGLVLPAAGGPQRFCTHARTFIQQDCCLQKKHCGYCPDKKAPAEPSCVSAAKVFPDGVNPDQLSIPPSAAVILPPFVLPEPVEIHLTPVAHVAPRDRAPPGTRPPLYLTHRSLLL